MANLRILQAGFICILLTIVYWYIEPIIEKAYDIEMPDEKTVAWFNIAILFGILNMFTIIMRCLGRAELGYLLGIFLPSILLLAVALIIPDGLHTSKHFNHIMPYIIFAYIVPILIAMIISYSQVRRKISKNKKANFKDNKIEWHHSSRIMMFYTFLATIANVIPIDVLKLFVGISVTNEQIGTFALAFNILYTIFTIPQLTSKGTVMALLFPLFAKGEHKSLQTIIQYSNRLSLAFNLSIVMLFIIFNKYISSLVSSKYEGFIIIFLALAVGFSVDLSLTITRNALLMLGKEKKILINRIISILIQVVLSIVTAYYWGIYGVCITVIIVRNFTAIQMMLELKKLGYKSL